MWDTWVGGGPETKMPSVHQKLLGPQLSAPNGGATAWCFPFTESRTFSKLAGGWVGMRELIFPLNVVPYCMFHVFFLETSVSSLHETCDVWSSQTYHKKPLWLLGRALNHLIIHYHQQGHVQSDGRLKWGMVMIWKCHRGL